MNIEKTISEHAVSDIQTPMLESQDRIVTEDVAPLFDQATGLDTPPASGTVTTTIEESRSVITAIIRKAWTATLTMLGGASVISYIAAAYTYLRNRLQGNETYGIPDRRSEISASSPLAANLALLNDRKIGEPNAVDGISLAQILLSADGSASITKIEDTNHDWTLDKAQPSMSGVTEMSLNCKKITASFDGTNFPNCEVLELPELEEIESRNGYGVTGIKNFSKIEELVLPKLKKLSHYQYYTNKITSLAKCKKIIMPEFETFNGENGDVGIRYCSVLEEIYAPNSKYLHSYGNIGFISNCPALKKIVLGDVGMNVGEYTTNSIFNESYNNGVAMPNLIHIEFGHNGQKVAYNLGLSQWSPTNALDPNLDTLIEEGSTAQNNLQQFLSNFRDYIALRLTDNGSGKTLTLSQAVRNAIHAAESTYGIENIIITQKGWTISPAPN